MRKRDIRPKGEPTASGTQQGTQTGQIKFEWEEDQWLQRIRKRDMSPVVRWLDEPKEPPPE